MTVGKGKRPHDESTRQMERRSVDRSTSETLNPKALPVMPAPQSLSVSLQVLCDIESVFHALLIYPPWCEQSQTVLPICGGK